MTKSTKLALCETWFDRVWRKRDAGAIDDLLDTKALTHGLGAQACMGPEEFRAFYHALSNLVSDVDITIDKAVETGDWISVLCTVRAKRRDNGEPVVITGQAMVRIEDGMIREAYNHFDLMGIFIACGLLPSDSFERCLDGQKVA